MEFTGKVIATRTTPAGLHVACIKTGELYGDLPIFGSVLDVAEGDTVRLVPFLQVKEGRLFSLLRVERVAGG